MIRRTLRLLHSKQTNFLWHVAISLPVYPVGSSLSIGVRGDTLLMLSKYHPVLIKPPLLQHLRRSLGFLCFYRLLLKSSLYHLISDEDRLTFELFKIQEP